jgi:hypothetical protein
MGTMIFSSSPYAATMRTPRRSATPIVLYKAVMIVLVVLAGLFCLDRASGAGTWTRLANLPPEGINAMLLLPDGTVMAAGDNLEATWYRLTPDSLGGYVNGTWSTLASMNSTRLYYSSAVLTNGRVLVAGGEYGTGENTAEVYDPIANTWTLTPAPPAGQTGFSDSISKILPNGNVLVAPVYPATSGGTAIYVTASNVWTTGPKLVRGKYQAEASWVKLPDDSILTVDPFGTNSERYIPALNRWINDANLPVRLYDTFDSEIGTAVLLPNGHAFFLGASGKTALYTPSGNTNRGTWKAGPVIPGGKGTPDAPAAMMVNGNILCAVSPTPSHYQDYPFPTSFYEYNWLSNSFLRVGAPAGTNIPNSATYQLRMLDLPDGNILLSQPDWQLYIYHPTGSALPVGKPAISTLAQNADLSFHVSGTGFNGISEGASYGDDAQMDSNYPLVRVTNSNTGAVYYLRTCNWTCTSVMTGNRPVSTDFVLPANLPAADYSLVVIANGISSEPFAFSTSALPPIVTLQPKSQSALAGMSPTFTVAAAGSPLSYFWYRDGSFIPGATGSSYTFTNAQVSDSGAIFTCVISNINGGTLCSNAILTVAPDIPVITVQPANQSAPSGSNATFTITATSGAPLSYFWKRGGLLIANATDSNYTITNVHLSDSGAVFSCLVSNSTATASSSKASLVVLTVPTNDTCASATLITSLRYTNTQSTIVAHSTGDPRPICFGPDFGKGVWYKFTAPAYGQMIVDTIDSDFSTGIATYTGACGALTLLSCNGSSYAHQAALTNTVSLGVTYYILAGGDFADGGNLVLHLTFTSLGRPAVIAQPQSQTVAAGTSATLSVKATGAAPLYYFWRRNGVAIPGATGSSYTTNHVLLTASGTRYTCLVSNASGSVFTSAAVLTVHSTAPDYFTEWFAATNHTNDLAFKSFTFSPDGTANFYSVCRETAGAFPTDPTGGAPLSLTDDSFARVTLSGTNTVAIYNHRTNVLFVGSNGYLTMNSGDTALSESFGNHFNHRRVSALFSDLSPDAGGTISWLEVSDHVAITYLGVPEYNSSNPNSFQIEMFFDGRIRLTYLQIAALDGLVGLSAGTGVPANFVQSDFTTYPVCGPQVPFLTAIAQPSKHLLLHFPTVAGQTYIVEYTADLASGNWIPLQTNLGDATAINVTNFLSSDPQRFFRLRLK